MIMSRLYDFGLMLACFGVKPPSAHVTAVSSVLKGQIMQ